MSVSSINDLTDHNRDGFPDNVSVHMWVAFYVCVFFQIDEGWDNSCLKFMLLEFQLACNQSLTYALSKKAKWFCLSFFFFLFLFSALFQCSVHDWLDPHCTWYWWDQTLCVSIWWRSVWRSSGNNVFEIFLIIQILLLMFDYYNTLIIINIFRHVHYCSVSWVAEEGAR